MYVYGYDIYLNKWFQFKVEKIECLGDKDVRLYRNSGNYITISDCNHPFRYGADYMCFGEELNDEKKIKLNKVGYCWVNG